MYGSLSGFLFQSRTPLTNAAAAATAMAANVSAAVPADTAAAPCLRRHGAVGDTNDGSLATFTYVSAWQRCDSLQLLGATEAH